MMHSTHLVFDDLYIFIEKIKWLSYINYNKYIIYISIVYLNMYTIFFKFQIVEIC